MTRLLILTDRDDCSDLTLLPLADFDVIVLAFWVSPEFVERVRTHGAREVWRLADLIPSYTELVERGFQLAQQLVAVAPTYRGINPLRAWENVVANALSVPVMVTRLATNLLARMPHAQEFYFLTESDTARAFRELEKYLVMPRVVIQAAAQETREGGGRSRLAAGVQLLRETRRTRKWDRLFWETLQVTDARYVWRKRFARAKHMPRGQVWAYSSYLNYTRVLQKHFARMTQEPQWLVNSYSAWQGLDSFSTLWQFKPSAQDSAHQEIFAQWNRAREILAQTADVELKIGLVTNQELNDVFTRVLALTLTEIDLMETFLDEMQPSALWVANQWGSEGALLALAARRNIPTHQLQHGTLEHFYRWSPIYSDTLSVWSDFWKRGITPSELGRVQVSEIETVPSFAKAAERERPRCITFFTAPPPWIKFGNPTVVLWEVVTMLTTLAQEQHSINVRIHPADEIDPYIQAWIKYCGSVPPNVRFDKYGALDDILKQTDVALMYFSTVFLDCLARGIPIVGLGWYDFVWKAEVQAARLIDYQNSLQELARDVGVKQDE